MFLRCEWCEEPLHSSEGYTDSQCSDGPGGDRKSSRSTSRKEEPGEVGTLCLASSGHGPFRPRCRFEAVLSAESRDRGPILPVKHRPLPMLSHVYHTCTFSTTRCSGDLISWTMVETASRRGPMSKSKSASYREDRQVPSSSTRLRRPTGIFPLHHEGDLLASP